MTKERSTRAINPTGEMRLQILVKSKTSQFLKSLLSVSTLMGPSGYGGGGFIYRRKNVSCFNYIIREVGLFVGKGLGSIGQPVSKLLFAA